MDNRFHFAKLFTVATPSRPGPSASAITKLMANCGQIIGRLGVGTLVLAWWMAAITDAYAQEGAEPGDVTWAIADDPPRQVLPASYSRTTTPAPVRSANSPHVEPAAGSLSADEQTLREPASGDRTAREQIAREQNTPDQSAPEQNIPEQSAREQSARDQADSTELGVESATGVATIRQAATRSAMASPSTLGVRGEHAGLDGRPRPPVDRSSAAAPLALAPSRRSLAVEPRGRAATHNVRGTASPWGSPGLFGALALVLGGTAAALWFGKRAGGPRRGRLPVEVFEQLGKAPLSPKLEAYLLRVGGKLVLVGVQAGEASPLTEITDPVEVQRIIAACASGGSAHVGHSLADASIDTAMNAAGRDGDSGGRASFAASLRRSLAQLETRNA